MNHLNFLLRKNELDVGGARHVGCREVEGGCSKGGADATTARRIREVGVRARWVGRFEDSLQMEIRYENNGRERHRTAVRTKRLVNGTAEWWTRFVWKAYFHPPLFKKPHIAQQDSDTAMQGTLFLLILPLLKNVVRFYGRYSDTRQDKILFYGGACFLVERVLFD